MIEKKLDKFEVKKSQDDGYSLVSKATGITYDLLEGKSYCGTSTSDMVFIFSTRPREGYVRLVNFVFGAEYVDDCLEACAYYILEFEAGREPNLSVDLSQI